MNIKPIDQINKKYNNIFIVQNREFWSCIPAEYDINNDLVLTFDFGLVNDIKKRGGNAYYFDHIVPRDIMHHYNFETYKYFDNWHYDKSGKDIFEYRGIDTGSAARIEIWNEMTYYPRILVCLIAVSKLDFNNLLAGLSDKNVIKLFDLLSLPFKTWECKANDRFAEYYFPVFRWMNEKIYMSDYNLKRQLILVFSRIYDLVYFLWERLPFYDKSQKYVFVWQYYPTAPILEKLKEDGKVKVVTTNYSWTKLLTRQRRLPLLKINSRHKESSAAALSSFDKRKYAKYCIEGRDIGGFLYNVILEKISNSIPCYFSIVDSIFAFFERKNLVLTITISDLGTINKLVMNYCKTKNIPTYLIINGLLISAYLSEAKSASTINAYGESIKNNYFSGMDNVVCLGDPRMDYYASAHKINTPCSIEPTILIGASGFNNLDLNSYTAVEFDYFNDIICVLKQLRESGYKMHVILKVRANGYIKQYRDFMNEYYPDFNIEILDKFPFNRILDRADLYISIYSQTLMEASCMGVSSIYYKKDTEISFPPFDNNSELITASNMEELKQKLLLFYSNSDIFESFKNKDVLQKYVGPLDGNNLGRNMNLIYSLIGKGANV